MIFCSMKNLNVVTWTTMISCFGVRGKADEVLNLFEKMKVLGFKPNSVTLTGILASRSHLGLITQSKKIFNSIRSSYDGQNVPSASVWGALLGGSSVHRNVETGEVAVRHLFEMEPKNASNYVALCSIYDSRGMWKDASLVRLKVRRLRLDKTPGFSCILLGSEALIIVLVCTI
ncbi:putative tetratricopeptide-like helical domain superfamily [Helianthus anomalus]